MAPQSRYASDLYAALKKREDDRRKREGAGGAPPGTSVSEAVPPPALAIPASRLSLPVPEPVLSPAPKRVEGPEPPAAQGGEWRGTLIAIGAVCLLFLILGFVFGQGKGVQRPVQAQSEVPYSKISGESPPLPAAPATVPVQAHPTAPGGGRFTLRLATYRQVEPQLKTAADRVKALQAAGFADAGLATIREGGGLKTVLCAGTLDRRQGPEVEALKQAIRSVKWPSGMPPIAGEIMVMERP